MCGRTALTSSPEDLRELFGLAETPLVPHYNVPPSQPLAAVRVLRRGPPGRHMDLLRWGLVPFWADDPKMGNRLALARVETAATTPAFREAMRRRRCLVVVDGFFEWKREGKKSHPFFVRRADKKPFALGGVWEKWVSKDGEVIESCAILTRPSEPPIAAIHDRMPLVLERGAWDRWLDPQLEDATDLLSAPPPEGLVAYSVSPHVNDPRHDDAACLDPDEPKEPQQRSLF
jgi:putative SOS response-associated peptidase YedK